MEALSKALKEGADLDDILAGARQFAFACLDDGSWKTPFVPMLSTWLNQRRWQDWLGEEKASMPVVTHEEGQSPEWDRIKRRLMNDIGRPAWITWIVNRVVFIGVNDNRPVFVYANDDKLRQWLFDSGFMEKASKRWQDEDFGPAEFVRDNVIQLYPQSVNGGAME